MYSIYSCCSLLDNNELLIGFAPEIIELKALSECQIDENQLINAAKMPACSERSITWYVTNQLKGDLSLKLQARSSLSHI